MAPVRAALDRIVDGHEPYATVVVDRRWNVVTANAAALSVLTEGVAPDLLAGRRHRPRRDHRRASHRVVLPRRRRHRGGAGRGGGSRTQLRAPTCLHPPDNRSGLFPGSTVAQPMVPPEQAEATSRWDVTAPSEPRPLVQRRHRASRCRLAPPACPSPVGPTSLGTTPRTMGKTFSGVAVRIRDAVHPENCRTETFPSAGRRSVRFLRIVPGFRCLSDLSGV